MKLSTLEEAVMLALRSKPRYGCELIEMLSHFSDGEYEIQYGSLYPLLQNLTKRRLIVHCEVQEDSEKRKGHSRKYYQLTELGGKTLFESESFRTRLREKGPEWELLL
jgi:DNA-binding PadR family transcriptional regulator